MENDYGNNISQFDVDESRETLEILYEMSKVLNCGLNRDSLSVLVSLVENGVNPEALSSVVKEMRKESFSINKDKSRFDEK